MTDSHNHSTKVLIITNERDFAADLVVKRLLDDGVEVDRWNTGDPSPLTWRPDEPSSTDMYSSVWLRQYLREPPRAASVSEIDDFLVTREQWRAWLTDLAEGDARWMNPLWAARRAENKLVQLRLATRVGMKVPPTVVTTSRQIAEQHQQAVGPCIVKAVSSAYFAFSDSAFMFTRDLADALDLDLPDWVCQPVVVQRRIDPRVDVRVFVVGDYVVAAGTVVEGDDWRLRSELAVWVPFELGEAHRVQCLSLARHLGIAYGAMDFAFDGEELWFLECNQAGEFAFVDRPLQLGIDRAIAGWLSTVGRVA